MAGLYVFLINIGAVHERGYEDLVILVFWS